VTMIFIISALFLFNFFFGEKFPVDGGLTWSGIRYAEMVRHLDSMISGGQLSEGSAQRILPSVIVRCMLLLTGTSMSDQHIIRGFELYNFALLIGAIFVWKRIADKMLLSIPGRWIGFSGIFINFSVSKHSFYAPVMTDVTALFIGMLLLLFFLEKKPIPLFLITIIGAFCWTPIVSICGACLLLFLDFDYSKNLLGRKPQMDSPKKRYYFDILKVTGLVISGLSIIAYIALKYVVPVRTYAYSVCANGLQLFRDVMQTNHARVFDNLLNGNSQLITEQLIYKLGCIFTAVPILFGFLIAILILIGSFSYIQVSLASVIKTRFTLLILVVLTFIIPKVIVPIISNSSVPNTGIFSHLILIIFLHKDGTFLLPIVSLAVFWGTVVIMLLLFWRNFCIEARKLGPGFVAVIGIHLFLGLFAEPRFITLCWPFFVLGLVRAIESSDKKASFKYVFITLSIVYAQFWLRINYAPWLSSDPADMYVLPKQLYFMHVGLFMSWWSYFIQFIVLVVSTILLRGTIINIASPCPISDK
jgi:hypothetical protein